MKTIHGAAIKKFNVLYRETDNFYHLIALESGISDSAFWCLYTICEYGNGCLQRDICNISSVSKQTIHSAIRKLEQEGYLYLKSGKGRDKHIFLTEAGERLVEEKIAPVIRMENEVMADIGKEGCDALLGLMEKYLELLRTKYEVKDEHSDIRKF